MDDPARIIFTLPNVANTFEVRTFLKLFQSVADPWIGQINPSDYSRNELVFFRKF